MNTRLPLNSRAHSLIVNRMLQYSELSVVIRAEIESARTSSSSVVKIFKYLHIS